jgi:DNA-binding transcriptional LysR family regulator
MLDLDTTTLRLFASVCDHGNMSRAAAQANLVASAVSKRLALLEDALGTPLLVRRRHGVAPTAAGETLLQHARSILMASAQIERDMADHAAGLQGRVAVLATASVMAEALADHVATFLKKSRHRNIRVDLEERTSLEVVRGVREGLAPIGICWDAAPMNGLETQPYIRDRLCVAVPADHTLAKRGSVHFSQTLAYEHVIMPPQTAVQVMLEKQAAALGKPLKHRVIVTNFEAALRVVRAGLAIAIVPREVAPLRRPDRGIVLVQLDEGWAPRQFVLCYRSEAGLTPVSKLVLEALIQSASG